MEDKGYKLFGVKSTESGRFLKKVYNYLQPSIQLSDGAFTFEDIKLAIKNKEMQLWIVIKESIIHSAIITEIKRFPHETHLNIIFLGGEAMDKWIHLMRDLLTLAKENGCDAVKVYGRSGWEKVLRAFGFKKSHVVLKANL